MNSVPPHRIYHKTVNFLLASFTCLPTNRPQARDLNFFLLSLLSSGSFKCVNFHILKSQINICEIVSSLARFNFLQSFKKKTEKTTVVCRVIIPSKLVGRCQQFGRTCWLYLEPWRSRGWYQPTSLHRVKTQKTTMDLFNAFRASN